MHTRNHQLQPSRMLYLSSPGLKSPQGSSFPRGSINKELFTSQNISRSIPLACESIARGFIELHVHSVLRLIRCKGIALYTCPFPFLMAEWAAEPQAFTQLIKDPCDVLLLNKRVTLKPGQRYTKGISIYSPRKHTKKPRNKVQLTQSNHTTKYTRQDFRHSRMKLNQITCCDLYS